MERHLFVIIYSPVTLDAVPYRSFLDSHIGTGARHSRLRVQCGRGGSGKSRVSEMSGQ